MSYQDYTRVREISRSMLVNGSRQIVDVMLGHNMQVMNYKCWRETVRLGIYVNAER